MLMGEDAYAIPHQEIQSGKCTRDSELSLSNVGHLSCELRNTPLKNPNGS